MQHWRTEVGDKLLKSFDTLLQTIHERRREVRASRASRLIPRKLAGGEALVSALYPVHPGLILGPWHSCTLCSQRIHGHLQVEAMIRLETVTRETSLSLQFTEMSTLPTRIEALAACVSRPNVKFTAQLPSRHCRQDRSYLQSPAGIVR